MKRDLIPEDLYIDANGALTERISTGGGQSIIVHYEDVPESDVTTVHGIRCTTPLRTIIDLATTTHRSEWEEMVRHCLSRRLFTRADALARVAEPDMARREGARILETYLRMSSPQAKSPRGAA